MVLMNLFSVFDPVSYFGFSFNWFILLVVMVVVPTSYYKMWGVHSSFFVSLNCIMGNLFKDISFPNFSGICFMAVGSFMFISLSNTMGLFPFIFTTTAHPLFTVGLGLTFWASFFLMGWVKNFTNSAGHLVPEGSPLMLAPFMVLIESISHLMRPLTLSIRLAANMMAGHLIIGLLASMSLMNAASFMVSMFLQGVLLILEIGVAVIQGFVFSILILLYSLEYY